MAFNWENFGNAYQILTAAERERKAKTQALQDLFQQELMKAQIPKIIEQRDPMYQLRQQILGQYIPQTGQQTQTIEQLAETKDNIVPIEKTQDYIINPNWALSGKGDMLIENPEVKEFKKSQALQKSEDIKQVTKARKDLDTYTSDAMQSLIAIDKIEKHAKTLGDFPRSATGQLFSRIGTGFKAYSKEKNVSQYLGAVAQELIPAARKIMEEKGPITEWDIARVERGLGDITTPLEDKIYLLNELRNKIKQALINKMEIAEIPKMEFSKKYKSVYQKAFEDQQQTTNRISVISPTGKRGTIPSNQLDKALQQGYKRG